MQCNSIYLIGYNNPVLLGDWDEHVAVFILIGFNAHKEAGVSLSAGSGTGWSPTHALKGRAEGTLL